jgi:hypothetical protein
MKDKEIKNITASILQRLKNYSETRHEDRGLTISNYAIERFLCRLSISKYVSQFVLKGAQLFRIWTDMPYRPTRDLDLLRYGNPDIGELVKIFQEICTAKTDIQDGIEFLPDTVKGEAIREDNEYNGIRIKIEFRIGRTGEMMQIDIGFGDSVRPGASEVQFPSILAMPPAKLKAYRPETVIAEKVEAMIILGMANSRMKDFFDVYKLSDEFEFGGEILMEVIQSTLARRKTKIPDKIPLAFTEEFSKDPNKNIQWKAFLRKNTLEAKLPNSDLRYVIQRIHDFIGPVFSAITRSQVFDRKWKQDKGWLKG